MVDLVSGLLGGAMGGGTAVADISRDKRKELAEHLKMQATEAIQERSDQRRFKQEDKTLERRITADESMTDKRIQADSALTDMRITADDTRSRAQIESAEGISGARNKTMMDLGKMQDQLKRDLANVEKGSAKASILKTQNDAAREAMKIYRETGDVTQANYILQNAGLSSIEEFEAEPGSSGFLGMGATPAKTGIRVAGSQLGSDLEGLLAASQGSEPPKKTGGIIGSAMADGAAPEPVKKDAPAKAPEQVEPIGELPGGMQFGRSAKGGYVIFEDGQPRTPSAEEMQQISQYVQQNPQMGGTAIRIPYTGPAGGYYNPEHYKNYRGMPGVKGAR